MKNKAKSEEKISLIEWVAKAVEEALEYIWSDKRPSMGQSSTRSIKLHLNASLLIFLGRHFASSFGGIPIQSNWAHK